MNRLPFFNKGGGNGKGEPPLSKEEQAKDIEMRRQACYAYAVHIFQLMAPGMSLEFQIPLRGQIITTDKPQQYGVLEVHKPIYKEKILGTFQPKP